MARPNPLHEASVALAEVALVGYAQGELTLKEALRWVSEFAKPCQSGFRLKLLGYTVEKALRIRPRKSGYTPPKYPRCLRDSAAKLVIYYLEEGYPLNEASKETGALELARQRLVEVGLCKPDKLPELKTLGNWYRERKKQIEQEASAAEESPLP